MTFEEFFKKKKIDLVALEEGNAGLFSEFKTHFEQMGDKSFDHSKKYWFNKLRRQYPLAPEVKVEKPATPMPSAESTPSETLTETVTPPPAPKMGFVPKFRAGNMPKPTASPEERKDDPVITAPETEQTPPENLTETAATQPVAKMGFVPKFRAGSMPKPATTPDEKKEEPSTPAVTEDTDTEKPAESTEVKPAYKPRFNMKSMPPKPSEE